jgi:hypothetical protein
MQCNLELQAAAAIRSDKHEWIAAAAAADLQLN